MMAFQRDYVPCRSILVQTIIGYSRESAMLL
uniref:Uncharacterized protein n=1 Tax=Arundo donax TaxID=35708 RepID=A0A0A9FNE7_ARUDO